MSKKGCKEYAKHLRAYTKRLVNKANRKHVKKQLANDNCLAATGR